MGVLTTPLKTVYKAVSEDFMRIALLFLLACNGGTQDDDRIIDTSVPSALPVAGTYRAAFDGTFDACDLGVVNDRILSVRRQYVLVLPDDAEDEAEVTFNNSLGDKLFDCIRDPSDGTYYCGEQFDQHIGDDSNTYSWTLVRRFNWATEDTGVMTIDSDITCAGATCPFETCNDAASYDLSPFLEFDTLPMSSCTSSALPVNALQESLIEVRNLNSQPAVLAWVSWDGSTLAQQTLSPGQTVRQRAYAGHPWKATINNSCVGVWTATENVGQFDIP